MTATEPTAPARYPRDVFWPACGGINGHLVVVFSHSERGFGRALWLPSLRGLTPLPAVSDVT